MTKIIVNLFRKMKVGAKYKQLMKQTSNEYIRDNSELITGAKIRYIAQSTFHTIK